MPKPTTLLEFATNETYGTGPRSGELTKVQTPDTENGFIPGNPVTAEAHNFNYNLIGLWIDYLNEFEDDPHDWQAANSFSGPTTFFDQITIDPGGGLFFEAGASFETDGGLVLAGGSFHVQHRLLGQQGAPVSPPAGDDDTMALGGGNAFFVDGPIPPATSRWASISTSGWSSGSVITLIASTGDSIFFRHTGLPPLGGNVFLSNPAASSGDRISFDELQPITFRLMEIGGVPVWFQISGPEGNII